MARIYKRCNCPEPIWRSCPHAWVVRYRTPGGRASNQREQSFAKRRDADDFALKVEHDKRAHVFIDPRGGEALFRVEAETWLSRTSAPTTASPPTGRSFALTCSRRWVASGSRRYGVTTSRP